MKDAERTAIEQKWGEALSELKPTGPCLTARELIEVAERGERARYYDRHIEHLAICSACREAVREMSEADLVRKQAGSGLPVSIARWFTFPRLAFAIPAAMAVVACAFLLAKSGWIGGSSGPEPIASHDKANRGRNPSDPNINPLGVKGEKGSRLVQDGPERRSDPRSIVAPGKKVPSVRSTLVASNWTIKGGRHIYNGIDLPDDAQLFASALTEGPTVDRGSAGGRLRKRPNIEAGPSEPKVVASWLDDPVEGNSALVETNPTFRLAADDAESRTVRILQVEADGSRTEISGALAVTGDDKPRSQLSATLRGGTSLKRGRDYVLEVRAKTDELIGGTKVDSEKTTAWRFRVLSENELSQYRWAKANEANLPVVAAIAFSRLGQYGDAERVCRVLDKQFLKGKSGGNSQTQPIERSSTWLRWRKAILGEYERRVSKPEE